MIDTRLKVFRSVATLLSFTKAANELFISQPAISKHIQELEKEYGVQLFDRIGIASSSPVPDNLCLTMPARLSMPIRISIST